VVPSKGLARTTALAFFLLITTVLMGCQLGYVLRQGRQQLRLLARRKPVEEALKDPTLTSDLKEGIRLVQQVRAFGEDRLGLIPSGAYRSFIKIEGDVVAYVISASPKDRLEPYLWCFPVVGSFPYKGFFRLDEAQAEKQDLEEMGYDTYLCGAAAFSSLGWFSDPLYSSMLRMDPLDLIYTVLHEMVHATVFFPDHVDFNEQLATLVGWRATVTFTETVYGSASPRAHRARDAMEDEIRMGKFLTWAYDRLAAFYASPLSVDERLRQRERVFEEIRARLEKELQSLSTARFSALKGVVWNNASLLALWRYRYDTGLLESLYEQLGRDLRALMTTVKRWRKLELDPQAALNKMLSSEDPAGVDPSMKGSF
jgi:predicted aminopeptidase